MCACSKPSRQPRTVRGSSIIVTRNTVTTTITPAPPNTLTSVQSMDPNRLRIEQLRREAIRRSFGSIV